MILKSQPTQLAIAILQQHRNEYHHYIMNHSGWVSKKWNEVKYLK